MAIQEWLDKGATPPLVINTKQEKDYHTNFEGKLVEVKLRFPNKTLNGRNIQETKQFQKIKEESMARGQSLYSYDLFNVDLLKRKEK